MPLTHRRDVGGPQTPRELSREFDAMDTNHDGVLDRHEFIAAISRQQQQQQHRGRQHTCVRVRKPPQQQCGACLFQMRHCDRVVCFEEVNYLWTHHVTLAGANTRLNRLRRCRTALAVLHSIPRIERRR